MSGVTTLLGDRGFWIAFGVATAGAALPVVLRRAGRHGALGSGLGIVAVLAALVGLRTYGPFGGPLGGWLVIGVMAVAMGAWAGAHLWFPLAIVATAPGGGLLAFAVRDSPGWVVVLVGLLTPVAVPLAVRLDRRLPRLGFLVLGISAGGLYACVPDTEPARPLLGALAPVALVVLLALGGRVKAHPGSGCARAGLQSDRSSFFYLSLLIMW